MNEVPYEYVQAGGYFGPDFTSVFFFQDVFWRVKIPLVYGSDIPVNTLESLVTMPSALKQELAQNPFLREIYKSHWMDCFDYSQNRHAFRMQAPDNLAAELIISADHDLLSAISDLSQSAPNSNAMHHARTCMEKTLKAFLCFRHGFTVEIVKKKFSHDLVKLAADVCTRDPQCDLARVQANIAVFAPYEDKYRGKQYSRRDLWIAYQIAQFAGAALLRILEAGHPQAGSG